VSTPAALYAGGGSFVYAEREVDAPKPGEVQIEVAYTGICGADLHIYHGVMDGRVDPPGVIGHEMSGRIAAIGDGLQGWSIGDPVTVMPLDWCGHCPACNAGYTPHLPQPELHSSVSRLDRCDAGTLECQ